MNYVVTMLFVVASVAFAQGGPPLSNVSQLFTPEVILALVFLLTIPMTTLVMWLLNLNPSTAGLVSNIVLNAIAKGVILVVTNQATVAFAVVATVLGIVLDKAIYDLITQRKTDQIQELREQLKQNGGG